jgi:methylated-DNA-[protein]-cysteine S-methyltransferase
MKTLGQKVFILVKKIPRGKVTTYQILAIKLGNKHLVRAIGNALSKNQELIKVPCHRVVKKNGKIGGYALGLAKKRKLLQNEGVKIRGNTIADLASYLYCFN